MLEYTTPMKNKATETVDKNIEKHLQDKRNELVWALSSREYTNAQIGRVFGINRSTVSRIIEKKPKDYKPKWVKLEVKSEV